MDNSDGLGLHAYTWNGIGPHEIGAGSFAVVDSVYAVAIRNGDLGKGIWLTEQGWKANEVGEALQARYLEESLEIVTSRAYVEAYFWFEFVDEAASFGLIRSNLTRRPSFDSVSQRP